MSPLRYYTKLQAEKIDKLIENKNVIIDYAMRYGNPSIKSKINKLHEAGCEHLLIIPLYHNMLLQQQQQYVMKFIVH